jgi:hypothetical protein
MLTTRVLRALPMREAERELRANIERRERLVDIVEYLHEHGPATAEELANLRPTRSYRLQRAKVRRGSRPRYRDDHYKQVADVYRAAYQAKEPPARKVADEYGVPPATARAWIARCREMGLLPPATERKPSA